MKKQLLAIAAFVVCGLAANAQTVSTFENIAVPQDSFFNGKYPDGLTNGYFESGNVKLNNRWDTSFGGYWAGGFAISSKKDSVTAGFSNMMSARTAAGYNNSANYAVAGGGARVILTGSAIGKQVSGFYVTNSTYAYISMRDGDQFAKKFGGATGDDPDFFTLKIYSYLGGVKSDSVEFYLADFRSADNSKDYILSTWEWVDLTSLGNLDSLSFALSSSDNGQFGMNTPAYFCLDNFTTTDIPTGVKEYKSDFQAVLYPNPTNGTLFIDSKEELSGASIIVTDLAGRIVAEQVYHNMPMDLQHLNSGLYCVKITTGNKQLVSRIIKN